MFNTRERSNTRIYLKKNHVSSNQYVSISQKRYLRRKLQDKYGFQNSWLKIFSLNHQEEMKNLELYGFWSLSWKNLISNNKWSWHSNFQKLPLHLPPKAFFHFMHLNYNLFYPFTTFLHSHFLHPLTTLQGVCWHWSCLHFHLLISLTLHKVLSSIFFLFCLPFLIRIFEHIIFNPFHIILYPFKEHYLKSSPSS